MPFINSISIDPPQRILFPYDVTGVRHYMAIQFDTPISFFVGGNGTGKSTILEVLGRKINKVQFAISNRRLKPSYDLSYMEYESP